MRKLKNILGHIFNANTLIYISLFVVWFIFLLIYATSKGYLNKADFFEGITVEAYGMLFDIFVLGIMFSIIYKFTENRRNIKRYLEEIDDFRGWDEKEAMYRNIGNIKRLLKLGVKGEELYLFRCNLIGVNLAGDNLSGARLWEANLEGADLEGADLTGAELKGANLLQTYLYETNLSGADLSRANLSGATLTDANLEGADFTGAHLKGADLLGVELIEANLTDADLFGVNLTGADLSKANLSGASLTDANLEGADFTGADLKGALNLTVEQLLKAQILFEVKGLSPEMEQELRKKKSELFEDPKKEDEKKK